MAPRGRLAEAAGLELTRGAIVVDAAMRTRRTACYAAGDVALAHNAAAGRRLRVEHWGEALNMGEIAGRSVAGETRVWDVAPGFWSTIGEHTLKYAAWGDGFDEARLVDHAGGAFTVWYGRDGRTVGVLAHDARRGLRARRGLIAEAPLPLSELRAVVVVPARDEEELIGGVHRALAAQTASRATVRGPCSCSTAAPTRPTTRAWRRRAGPRAPRDAQPPGPAPGGARARNGAAERLHAAGRRTA